MLSAQVLFGLAKLKLHILTFDFIACDVSIRAKKQGLLWLIHMLSINNHYIIIHVVHKSSTLQWLSIREQAC